MQPHHMELPKYIVIGEGLADVVVERVRVNGYKRCLMVTSKTPYKVFGVEIDEKLSDGFDCEVLYADDVVQSFEKYVSEAGSYDVVLSIGGGRVADISKTLAEYAGKDMFSIPTVASHDGIASPMSSFRKNGAVYSRKSVMPTEVFADMSVISLAPKRYVLSGCGDLVAKHSAVRDWWLAHRVMGEYYGRYAAHLAYLSASVVMRSAKHIASGDKEGVRTVVEALISAGISMGVAGSSRPCSGSEHLIAHALETLMEKPALHGERCGVATIFTTYLHNADWERVRRGLKSMGAAYKLSHIGVDSDLFVEAVKKAPHLRRDRYTILSHKQLTDREILEVIQETELV